MSDCRFGVSPVNYPDLDPDHVSNKSRNFERDSSSRSVDKSPRFIMNQLIVVNRAKTNFKRWNYENKEYYRVLLRFYTVSLL